MSHTDTLPVRLQESNAKDAERVEADEGACFFPLSDLLRKSPSPLVERGADPAERWGEENAE